MLHKYINCYIEEVCNTHTRRPSNRNTHHRYEVRVCAPCGSLVNAMCDEQLAESRMTCPMSKVQGPSAPQFVWWDQKVQLLFSLHTDEAVHGDVHAAGASNSFCE